MNEPRKVLFVTAPIGSGHMRAAQAVMKAIERLRPDVETRMANIFDFINPSIGRVILNSYLKVLEYFPQAYGMAYGWGNTNRLALFGRELISGYMAARMESFIAKYSPTTVVCTHATPAGMVAQLVKDHKLNIPSIAVVTDYTVHRLWVYPEVDYYFVAHSKMQEDLAHWGVPHTRSQAVGIPVDRNFLVTSDRAKILNGLQLDYRMKTLLIMGGGAGVVPMDRIVSACDEVDAQFQIITVAGNNHSMYRKIASLQGNSRHRIKALGFVNNVHELMAASDLLISKPGGMTSAEAVCRGLPMIIFKPIPGQEEANTQYLVNQKAAIKADTLGQLQGLLNKLFVDRSSELGTLKENAFRLGQPQAAEIIASHILANC